MIPLVLGPSPAAGAADPIAFPPGQGRDRWEQRTPAQAGINPKLIEKLKGAGDRWALWRDGYLVHVEGDFNHKQDVASLRKTWHAMIVGAALHQKKIASFDEKISRWQPELKGHHADATWRHVLTQSSGFDYPYGNHPAYRPGEMWTYSDLNLIHLCHALAKVYGKKNYRDDFADVARKAYFDAIGMQGWSTRMKVDSASGLEDGVRFVLNLDHMGRLGLLALARGRWKDRQLVSRKFVEELETKQTSGMKVNYNGPNDGKIDLKYKEVPYGYLTWVNTDQDVYPRADRAWAWGSGAGGNAVFWNHKLGIVFAIQGRDRSVPVPELIEAHLTERPGKK
jgi:CubicO group peptidase (beta-lactamase class C family)